jgi:hypothetical protein
MSLKKSYFNGTQWILTAEDAAKWKPGPCVVWEITGQCPKGAKCTCAHLDRGALNDKNQRNKLGNYVEATLPARCKYVLKQIKGGQWAHMKGLVRADVPCLVELLEWLPAQPGGEIDVDVVQSFISANKVATATSAGAEPDENQFSADLKEEQDHLKAWAYKNACAMMINWIKQSQMELVAAPEEEDFRKEERLLEQFWAAEEQRYAEEKAEAQAANVAKPVRNWAVLAGAGAVKAPTVAPTVKGEVVVPDSDLDDYEWKGMGEEKKLGLM